MKITLGPLSFDIFLLIRLCWPAVVFVGLCGGILLAFDPVLLMIDQFAPAAWQWPLIGIAWLSLLILYIILGVVFTHLVARLIRRSFGTEALRVQRRMATLSGLPFYALCLFGLLVAIFCFLFPDMVNALTGFIYEVCFVVFALVSCCYFFLLRFLLGRATPIAYQARADLPVE